MSFSQQINLTYDAQHVVTYDTARWSYPQHVVFEGGRSGVKVADYKEKIRLGLDASSPFVCDLYRLENQRSGMTRVYANYKPNFQTRLTQGFDGVLTPPPKTLSHLLVSSSKAKAIALSSFYKKLDSELSTLHGASVVAEFVDVIRQFGKPADALVDLTNRHLNRLELERRGLKGSVSFKRIKWLQILASTYLEWSFGLAPLISDTRTAAEALARFNAERSGELLQFRKRVVARGFDEAATSTTQDTGPSNVTMAFKNAYVTKTRARCQYVAGLNTSLVADFGSAERLQQVLGFKSQDWLPALWEVIPWSWLVDYFSNVQQIISAAATSTSSVSWVNRTESTVTSLDFASAFLAARTQWLWDISNWSASTVGSSGGSWRLVRTTVNRTVMQPNELGVPPLYLELPEKAGQLANLVAVLFARRPSSSALWLT